MGPPKPISLIIQAKPKFHGAADAGFRVGLWDEVLCAANNREGSRQAIV